MKRARADRATPDDDRATPDANSLVGWYGGLILAAGAGLRFGAPHKLLADLNGRPLLEHAIHALCATAEIAQVVVVLGAQAADLLAAIDFGEAHPLVCPDWEAGQARSLQAGIAALAGAGRVVVTLGDAPLVTPAVITRVLEAGAPARAVYRGRPGHPVLLGPAQLHAAGSLRGDHGARALLAAAVTVECSDLSSGRDVDTPEDLEAIREEAGAVL